MSMMDEIALDLAMWIDETATEVALAFAPARAPFSAKVTEQQKLEFYKTRLFDPDGSPNVSGRNEEMARLGEEGFAKVYKAVVQAHPELKPPPQELGGLPPAPGPLMPPGPPQPAGLPPGGPPPMIPPEGGPF